MRGIRVRLVRTHDNLVEDTYVFRSGTLPALGDVISIVRTLGPPDDAAHQTNARVTRVDADTLTISATELTTP